MDTSSQSRLMERMRASLVGDVYSHPIRTAPDAQDLFLWTSGELLNDTPNLAFSVMLHVVPDYITYGKTENIPHRTILIGMDFAHPDITLSYIQNNTKLTGCTGKIAGLLNLLKLVSVQERRNLPIKIIPASIYTPDDKTGRFFITHKEIIFPIRYTTATAATQENQNAQI